MDKPETMSFSRRNLPHWMVDSRPYFVTLRLKGSLPRQILLELQNELERFKASRSSKQGQLDFERKRFARVESVLDRSDSEIAYLANNRVAAVVSESLSWLENELGWTIFASTILPNHIHLLMQHLEGRNSFLTANLGRMKSYTGIEANKILGRSGAFWQPENFDHWVRNEAKYLSCAHYILNNPVKAGLAVRWSDWQWTRVVNETLPLL